MGLLNQVKKCIDWFSFAEIDPLIELGAQNRVSSTSAVDYLREGDTARVLLDKFNAAYDADDVSGFPWLSLVSLRRGRLTWRCCSAEWGAGVQTRREDCQSGVQIVYWEVSPAAVDWNV